jgi:hypothetical protein
MIRFCKTQENSRIDDSRLPKNQAASAFAPACRSAGSLAEQ